MSGTPALVVIGAGPRGTGLIERIAANAPALYGERTLTIHLVDPYPPGGGRIWRHDQSPLLRMNSMAEDVTMFTDDTVRQEGPVRPGPALHTWAADIRDGRAALPDGADVDPGLLDEIKVLEGSDFPSRRLQSVYLRWVYERAVAALPEGVTVHWHRGSALRVSGPPEGRQRVWLEGRGTPLLADAVVVAIGHLDAEPEPEQVELAGFADRHGLVHLPPDFTADADLSEVPAGEPVIVRGFGLAFVDLMVLLTEGRGGRYEDGEYVPSGREPLLHIGSRRGVPYHSKIGYGWEGERPPLPRFLGPELTEALLKAERPVDFRRDVWPHVDKELGYAHYHRLFTAHPERTTGDWAASRRSTPPPTRQAPDWPPSSRPPSPTPRTGSTSKRSTTRWTGCATPRSTHSRRDCADTSPPTWNAATIPATVRTSPSSSDCCPSMGS